MTKPHFTIVIPTRNRLRTLKHAIRTCLEQEYENFSVIVANNNCSDGTGDYVASLNDPRVVQLTSDADLPMGENWGRVMPEAISRGGFVTYLGDDDGLLPGALALAASIIQNQHCEALTWRKVEYAWPDVVVGEYRNYFSISIDPTLVIQDSAEFLAGIHDRTVGYDEGPGLYSSFVSAAVLARLAPAEGGSWFAAFAPDIYSCFAIAGAVPEYCKCKFGLTVNGASGSSNGTSYMHRPQSDLAAAFRGQNEIHAALSHAPSIAIAEADALLVARERFPAEFAQYDFSWASLIRKLLSDIQSAPSRTHYDLLVVALHKAANYSGQPQPEVPEFVERVDAGLTAPKPVIDTHGKRITTIIDEHLASNVFDAAVFANSIFPLGALTPESMTLIGRREDGEEPATGNSNTAHRVAPESRPANPLKRLGRPLVRRVRKYRRWLSNAEKIESWFAREGEISSWMRNDAQINAMIRSHEDRQAREQAARSEFEAFKRLSEQAPARDLKVDWDDRYLCLDDKTQETAFDRHYIYHPAWAARVLAKTRPQRHTDFSSTLNFCALVSAFIPVDFYDYRPAPLQLSGLNSLGADLLSLPFENNRLESASCMHVLEHVGLGRYGDPIDPDGDIKAIRELCRVLAPGGNLLIAVPVGEARVQFNAHRVYRHRDFVKYFEGFELVEFALIPDGTAPNGLIYAAPEHLVDAQKYGCGCYWFRKKA